MIVPGDRRSNHGESWRATNKARPICALVQGLGTAAQIWVGDLLIRRVRLARYLGRP